MKEKQRLEAIERMRMLGIHENAIKEFEEEGKINKSEAIGFLYWLNEEEEKLIKNWEEETGNMAYHVIFNNTPFGRMLSILYVSKYEEEWEFDRKDIENNMPIAYVMNLDDEMLSEAGTIVIKRSIGGLIRVL